MDSRDNLDPMSSIVFAGNFCSKMVNGLFCIFTWFSIWSAPDDNLPQSFIYSSNDPENSNDDATFTTGHHSNFDICHYLLHQSQESQNHWIDDFCNFQIFLWPLCRASYHQNHNWKPIHPNLWIWIRRPISCPTSESMAVTTTTGSSDHNIAIITLARHWASGTFRYPWTSYNENQKSSQYAIKNLSELNLSLLVELNFLLFVFYLLSILLMAFLVWRNFRFKVRLRVSEGW